MAFRLAPTAIAEGYRLDAHETVGSTNALAIEHARAGDPGKLWVVASRQESGRGRRGRAWATPDGNLAATLLLVSDARPSHRPPRSASSPALPWRMRSTRSRQG